MLELIAKRGRAIVDARGSRSCSRMGDSSRWRRWRGRSSSAGGSPARAGEGRRRRRGQRRRTRLTDLSGALAEALGSVPSERHRRCSSRLSFRGTAYGVLVAANDSVGGARLGAEDARLLEAFAALPRMPISTTRSVAADRLRHSIDASERERRRWARELHDETLQGLGGLQVLLSSAAARTGSSDLPKAVDKAVAHLTEEIAIAPRLITELRPAALDELGLVPAIETLAQRTASVEGLTVETNIELGLEAARAPRPGGGEQALSPRAGGAHEHRQARRGEPDRDRPVRREGVDRAERLRRRRRIRSG